MSICFLKFILNFDFLPIIRKTKFVLIFCNLLLTYFRLSFILVVTNEREVHKMKTLRRGISYNLACSIMDANHYGVDKVVSHFTGDSFVYAFKNKEGKTIARYIEKYGKLQVVTN